MKNLLTIIIILVSLKGYGQNITLTKQQFKKTIDSAIAVAKQYSDTAGQFVIVGATVSKKKDSLIFSKADSIRIVELEKTLTTFQNNYILAIAQINAKLNGVPAAYNDTEVRKLITDNTAADKWLKLDVEAIKERVSKIPTKATSTTTTILE